MQMNGSFVSADTLPCGICRTRVDENGTFHILWANEEYYMLFGYTGGEAEDAGVSTVDFAAFPLDIETVRRKVSENLKKGNTCFQFEMHAVHKSGKELWIWVRCKRDEADPALFHCIVLDITVRRDELEELLIGEEEKRILLKHTRQFLFRFDVASHTAILTPDAAAEFGLPEAVGNLPDCMVEQGHVARESIDDYIDFYQRIINGEPSGESVVCFKNNKGAFCWYHGIFSMVYDHNGQPRHAVVSFEDVSIQRDREMAYEKWSQYYQTQLTNAIACYECNLTKNLFDRIEGPFQEDIPKEVRSSYDTVFAYVVGNLVYEEDRPRYGEFLNRERMIHTYRSGERELKLEYRRLNREGAAFWVEISVQLLPDPYSEDIKAFFLVKNIDEEKRTELELQRRSEIDALTGLLNRHAVVERINDLLENSSPSDRHVFVMVDIDRFKGLNDQYGHQFGDQVLVELADTLRSSLRSGDLVGRLGGDEFVLCLKNMPLNNVLEEKMGTLCSRMSRYYKGDGAYVSGSLGIATYPKDGITFDELYQKADIALYEAKNTGRNRYSFYHSGMGQQGGTLHNNTPIDQMDPPPVVLSGIVDWSTFSEEAVTTDSGKSKLLWRYMDAVRNTYDDMLAFNVTENYFHAVYRVPHKYKKLKNNGTLQEIILNTSEQLIHPEDTRRFQAFFSWEHIRQKLEEGQRALYGEFRRLLESGEFCWTSMTIVPIILDDVHEIYLCMIRDIDKRKQLEETAIANRAAFVRQVEDECYRTIMELCGMTLIEYSQDADTYYVSPSAAQFTFMENVGKMQNNYFLSSEDVHPEDWAMSSSISQRIRDGASNAQALLRLKRTDGSYLWCQFALTVLRREDGKIRRSLITITDVDEATQDRQALEYQAVYDELTGYSNYAKYKQDVKHLLENRGTRKYSLWYCDLRNFKLINDRYGYDFGDRVLKYWAEIGAKDCREGETFARISADHFTSLRWYDDLSELEERFRAASEALAAFGERESKELRIELVTGIYRIEADEDVLSIEDMIDRANLAQKSVKQLEGSRFAVFTDEMRANLLREKEMEAAMYRALLNGEFKPYFQPIADAQSNGIIGAEVLARWERPGYGLIPPIEFIPLFEKNGTIMELDLYMFTEACKFLRRWIDSGRKPIVLSINVSQLSVFQKDFVERYVLIKEQYDIPDGCLELECTESTAVENTEMLEMVMRKMRVSGFYFSMDDFGSGYSSLNLLKDISVDVLKLDMIFFRNGRLQEYRNYTIVSSIVFMAKALDMRVIAEGVETEDQRQILRELGCDYIQGYLISKPVPSEIFEQRYPNASGFSE